MGGQLDGRADQYALAATAFHLLTGAPPFQHSNPAVVISQHLSASPPAISAQRPELSALDPVLAKALSKDPKDRFERCADFANALTHRLDAAPTGDVGTILAPAVAAPKRSLLRAGVIVPAILTVLLLAAVTVAVMEFRGADRPAATSTTPKSPTATPTFMPPPPPPEPVAPPSTTAPPAPPPTVVIGANCTPAGSTGTTDGGSTAYCSILQPSGTTVWSLQQGSIPSPTVTTEQTDTPLPTEDESPIRVCMQQTGKTRLQCWESIRRSNGLRVP
jgi:serine/threonine-protein kinase